jgi:hypothetical protein
VARTSGVREKNVLLNLICRCGGESGVRKKLVGWHHSHTCERLFFSAPCMRARTQSYGKRIFNPSRRRTLANYWPRLDFVIGTVLRLLKRSRRRRTPGLRRSSFNIVSTTGGCPPTLAHSSKAHRHRRHDFCRYLPTQLPISHPGRERIASAHEQSVSRPGGCSSD